MIISHFQAKYPLSYNQFSTEKINIVSLLKSLWRKIVLLMQLAVSTTILGIFVLEFIKPPNLAVTGKLWYPEFLEMTLHAQGNFQLIWKADNEHLGRTVGSAKSTFLPYNRILSYKTFSVKIQWPIFFVNVKFESK